MPYRWFSTDHGSRWNPQKGYNQLFASEVQNVRSWFFLEKAKSGLDNGTDRWREYTRDNTTYYVSVTSFEWGKLSRETEYESQEFKLKLDLSTKPNRSKIFFSQTLIILFPVDYPTSRPNAIVDSPRFRSISYSHSDHILEKGVLCLTSSDNTWNSERDTVITLINWAVEWIHLHYTTHGW